MTWVLVASARTGHCADTIASSASPAQKFQYMHGSACQTLLMRSSGVRPSSSSADDMALVVFVHLAHPLASVA